VRVAAEVTVGDARDPDHLERDRRPEHPDVPGVDPQRLARHQLVRDHVAGQLGPRPALAAEAVQDEALAGEDPGPERLLEAGRDLDAGRARQKAVPVHQVLRSRAHVDRQDAAGHLRGERDGPRTALRRIGAHQRRRAAHHALERTHQAPATHAAADAGRRLGGHLDRIGHPGELAGLGHHALTRVEVNRQHGHRRPVNLLAHGGSSQTMTAYVYAAGTGARILETMYRAARPGWLRSRSARWRARPGEYAGPGRPRRYNIRAGAASPCVTA
jgi:hypothetical protein